MGQTNKQAYTGLATHWKSGVFNVENNWDALDNPPMGWTVYKKKEIAPTTQQEHYQVHVDCGKQVRLSALIHWLPRTRWFEVKGADHIRNSIAYIDKEATTAPGAKLQIVEGEKYLACHELLMEVARSATFPYKEIRRHNVDDNMPVEEMIRIDFNNMMVKEQYTWRSASKSLIRKDMKWISKLSNPVLSTLWHDYHAILLEKVEEERAGGGPLSLKDPRFGLPNQEESKFILESPSIDEDASTTPLPQVSTCEETSEESAQGT